MHARRTWLSLEREARMPVALCLFLMVMVGMTTTQEADVTERYQRTGASYSASRQCGMNQQPERGNM